MSVQHWDLRPNGDLAVHPCLGFETATAQLTGLVRLIYAENEQQFESGGVALQLAMTPVQLRSLSQGLLKMATAIEAQPLGTKQ